MRTENSRSHFDDMGTTRIKVIDLSGEKEQIKTSRKHAEKLAGLAKIKETKKPKAQVSKETKGPEEPKITEPPRPSAPSVPPEPSAPSVIKKQAVSPVVARKHRHHLGQKYLAATALIEKNKLYPTREAIDLLYQTSTTRFDPTVELHLNVADKNIRGSLNLPHAVGTKKEKRILIFSNQKPESKNQKHLIWGNQQTIADIESGKLKPNRDFDVVLAQPKFMPLLAKIAKILGPAGLMPNPKNQTITENVLSALEGVSSATFEYKTDPSAPIVHTKLGKLSYKPEQLTENLKALVNAIGPAKIRKATLTTTMGPGIKVDIASIQ